MVKYIKNDEQVLAIIIKKEYHADGIEFFTELNYSQQLAYMSHSKGKVIDSHIHNFENRNVVNTQEVLIIRKGILRVDFYTQSQDYLESYLLHEGDVILLASGGHGFKVIDDVEMIEVKQGPYLGEGDKVRFEGIDDSKVIIKE